ncbi:MAG TPA: TonB-dependent receptor [Azospira sp.]|nr:TonB-dependent receptor [Accumulibacter sp.]HNJ75276.1 TonB-dependent receptor [Azospira sp.]HNN07613.1 TonB-dependent receptor [Azospira sp.]HNN44669.1 TonB-dependent receptor [Azospira sp.]
MQLALRPLAAALAALCTTPLAFADTALAPVSVTAKGYESDTLTTPSSVFVGDGDALRKNGANNLGEALRGEVGFSATNDGAQGQNPVIRGIKKEGIVLLVDGMRFNSAQPQGAIASFMALGLADRVEAVKGPASVLYGTGAIGGAINVLLPQARFEPGAKATLGASYDSASKGFRGTGLANLSQGDHALMVGTSLANIDDYKAPDGRVDRTSYDSQAFIGQYRFRIDGQQQLRLSLQQQTDEDVWYPGSTKRFTHPNAGVAAAVQSTTIHSPKQDRALVEVGYSYKGSGESPLNVDVRAYQQNMKREIYSWSNRLNRNIAMTHVTFETTGLDAKADWLIHPQHLLSFGMNLWEMEASPQRTIANPPNSTVYVRSDPFDDGRIKAAGAYLQDDMRFGRLNVLAAGRYDKVSGSADSVANSANPLGTRRTSGLDRDDGAFSGSLGASYEVAPLFRPYASLSRGFRAGEMRERYESSPRGDGYYYVGDPQIKPEISTQFELGIKGQSDKLAWSVAAFRNQIRDYMSGQDISGTARATALCGAANAGACKETVNISKVVIDGFEAQGKWQAWQGHWLKAGLTILRGENEELNEPLFQMPADELSLGWEGHVAAGWTADVTGRFVREQDRVATTFSRGSENKTAGFATADLGATYKLNKQHSFRVALKNLFDRKYHEALTEGVSGQEIHMPGRSLYLSWKGDF